MEKDYEAGLARSGRDSLLLSSLSQTQVSQHHRRSTSLPWNSCDHTHQEQHLGDAITTKTPTRTAHATARPGTGKKIGTRDSGVPQILLCTMELWERVQFLDLRRKMTNSSSHGCNRHSLANPDLRQSATGENTRGKEFSLQSSPCSAPAETITERDQGPCRSLLHPRAGPSTLSTGSRRGRATRFETTSMTTRRLQ
jgi:hypothetical protein